MTRLVVVLSVVHVVAVSIAVSGQAPQSDGPQYVNGTSLVRPADYREWPFIGAALGMTYDQEPGSSRTPSFTNVYVNPSSYRAFMQTGKWTNGTIFMLESRRAETDPGSGGRFQGTAVSLEAEVKDSRFPDEWAFFSFGRGGMIAEVAAPLSGDVNTRCVECHINDTAVERTFVQFYPELLEVARRKGTLKPGF